MPKALITGITGQDGSYLAELLLDKGYKVYGLTRASDDSTTSRIDHVLSRVHLIKGDLLDQASVFNAVEASQPDEIYNLAAQSSVQASWNNPVLAAEFSAAGVTRVLEAMRKIAPKARFFQASSSEIFGNVRRSPQNENTDFSPRSPYGAAKVYGHWMTVNYRETLRLHCNSGILFNHESPRRGLEFVTRKITHTVAQIKHGLATELRMGPLDGHRDWGFAGDYVEAMWLMLQQEQAGDYVIATGETHTVQEFVEAAFQFVDLDLKKYLVFDERFNRPKETGVLVGDISKARKNLQWQPKMPFKRIVETMVRADLDLIGKSK